MMMTGMMTVVTVVMVVTAVLTRLGKTHVGTEIEKVLGVGGWEGVAGMTRTVLPPALLRWNLVSKGWSGGGQGGVRGDGEGGGGGGGDGLGMRVKGGGGLQ